VTVIFPNLFRINDSSLNEYRVWDRISINYYFKLLVA